MHNNIKKEVYGHNIKNNKVKDNYFPSIYNTGFIGNANFKGNEKEWKLWRGIIRRCYGKEATDYGSYGGKGVKVDSRWHSFELFLEDIFKIEGYDKFKFREGLLQLDKDKKQQSVNTNKKVYSLKTCCFLTLAENQIYKKNKIKILFYALSPQEEIIEWRDGISKFAKEYSLTGSSITLCLQGKYKHHKNWRFYNDKEDIKNIKQGVLNVEHT